MNSDKDADQFPYVMAVAIGLIAVLDVSSSHLTIPVIYTIPILLYALSLRRRWLLLLAMQSVALTFVGLAIKVHFRPLPNGQTVLGWRLLNRSFAAASVCICAALLHYWVGFIAILKEHAVDTDGKQFRQILRSVTTLLAAIVGGTLTGCILIADILSPAAANLPILYAVPLTLVALWLEDRRAIWFMLPFLLIFSVIGLSWGPMTSANPGAGAPLMNRVLACGVLVVVAIVLHIRLGKHPISLFASTEGKPLAQSPENLSIFQ